MFKQKFLSILFVAALSTPLLLSVQRSKGEEQKPIVLKTMGSLFFGGTVTEGKNGGTFHGDHGYAQYYIPLNSRNYPLIMWHGIGQSGKTYESTPDGREGYQAIMTRRDWPVYIIDQPRRGRAGRTQAKPNEFNPPVLEAEHFAWNAFRVGIWNHPEDAAFFPDVQFPKDGYSLDQFMRQQTPDTGGEPRTDEYRTLMGETMADLFRMTGPAVLITHSNSGQYGWTTAMTAPDLVKAIVAYEPGAVVFPEGEVPDEIPTDHPGLVAAFQPRTVPMEEFGKLTKMPIIIIYGDYIPKEPFKVFDTDLWRGASSRAKQFVEAVNRHGGDATFIVLSDIGLKGNTHFPFADLNNLEVADHIEKFLHAKKLDGRDKPHRGPRKNTMPPTIPLQKETPPKRTDNKMKETNELKITIGNQVVTATLEENPTTRDFVSLLPLTVRMEDYNKIEKISRLSRKLSIEGAPSGHEPSVGDVCVYSPWGNLCIFYKNFGYSNGLIKLGKIDKKDIEKFDTPGSLEAKIELLKD